MCRRLRAAPAGIDLVGAAADDRFVKRILDEWPRIGHAEEPLEVGLVLGEKKRRARADRCPGTTSARPGAGGGLVRETRSIASSIGAFGVETPRPGIAKPELRQDMQRGRIGTSIIGRDPAEYIVLAGLGVIDENIEITPRGEGTAEGVDQLELAVRAAAKAVFLDKVGDKDTRPADTCRASA